MQVQSIASVAVITEDPARSRQLYIEALGLPLEGALACTPILGST